MSAEDYVRMTLFHKRKRQRKKAWKKAMQAVVVNEQIQYSQLVKILEEIKSEYKDRPKTLKSK